MKPTHSMLLAIGLCGLSVVQVIAAQEWEVAAAPSLPWKAVACSSDGTKLVATGYQLRCCGGLVEDIPFSLYVSTNSGGNWMLTTAPTNFWSAVASSADGRKLVAVTLTMYGVSGSIYTSSDSGATWIQTPAPGDSWSSVACSADGTKLVAVSLITYDALGAQSGGLIYTSVDSGATWIMTTALTNAWARVASSADGTRLTAVARGEGLVYVSTNAGVTWTATSAPQATWQAVTASADGTRLAAAVGGLRGPAGSIFNSTNSGLTWTPTTAPSNVWMSLASSADGKKLVAAATDLILTSTDSGTTWTSNALHAAWSSVACSADGSKLTACGGGIILTYPYLGPWRVTSAPRQYWRSILSSADGSNLLATASQTNLEVIYASTNSGGSWAQVEGPAFEYHLAGSADATKLVAAAPGGLVYTSTNSGASWWPNPVATNSWTSVASSADGTRLVAVAGDGSYSSNGWIASGAIYCSSNSGATWRRTTAPNTNWVAVASSADGTRLAAAVSGGTSFSSIYTSTNSGDKWTQAETLVIAGYNWTSLACSADGSRMVATAYGDSIYTSTNFGTSWEQTTAPALGWTSVACSADGAKLAAVADNFTGGLGFIYVSSDCGVTWLPANTPAASWIGVALSADGAQMVAADNSESDQVPNPNGDPIYMLRTVPEPRLAATRSPGNLRLSWLVTSTTFVLQQSSDLGATNWIDVPLPPTLNFTNLHYEVTTPLPTGNQFYLLKQKKTVD